MSLNVLSLFAGIGGLDLGLERAGMTVVGQVEIDPYCQRVLAKHWPDVPRHDDVRTAADWWLSTERAPVDVICGGFPCQPVSLAGQRRAQDDERWLWPAFAHTVRVLRPSYVLMENVPGLLTAGLGDVLADLATLGYDCEWQCLPAAAFGAPHLRWRWFGIAYPNSDGLRVEPVSEQRGIGAAVVAVDGAEWHVADADGMGRRGEAELQSPGRGEPQHRSTELPDAACVGRRQGRSRRPARGGQDRPAVWPQALADTGGERRDGLPGLEGVGWQATERSEASGHAGDRSAPRLRPADHWAVEPDVGRVAHGVPARVDRLRALGNAVVPQVAEYVGRLIVDHATSLNGAA